MAIHTYKLTISYNGSDFSGWQVQNQARTIQQEIVTVLHFLLKTPIKLVGAGRTDAGVHALGQVAHFRSELSIDPFRLKNSLNALLPSSIRILKIKQVANQFHAQRSAIQKEYHYHLGLNEVLTPFSEPFSYHIRRKIDLSLLNQAAKKFVGTHNFLAFSNEANKGAASKNAIRTLTKVDIVSETEGVRIEFAGNGFLYKMVRNIVGTLCDVAIKKREFEDIDRIFFSKDRKKASHAAPAKGLFLMSVTYPEELEIHS